MWSEARGSAGVIGNAAPDPEIILDLSRLLSRVLHPTPTGIDRVEMAYAREMLRMIPERLVFAAVHPTGSYGRLPRKTVLAFLDETERLWNGEIVASKNHLRLGAAQKLLKLRPKSIPDAEIRTSTSVYPGLAASSDQARSAAENSHARTGTLRVPRSRSHSDPVSRICAPGGAELHRQRMDTLGLYADALIANSAGHPRCAVGLFRLQQPSSPDHGGASGHPCSHSRAIPFLAARHSLFCLCEHDRVTQESHALASDLAADG